MLENALFTVSGTPRAVTLVTLPSTGQGRGATLKLLFAHALEHKAEAVVVLHGDRQSIPQLLQPFDENRAEIVLGSRTARGLSFRLLTAMENLSFDLKLSDYHSGCAVYSQKTIASIPFRKLSDTDDFDLEMIVMARIRELRILNVPMAGVANSSTHWFRMMRIAGEYKYGTYDRLER